MTIRLIIPFRLGEGGENFAGLATGRGAANAWMGLAYTIRNDRTCRIRIIGSYMPSQTFYLNWTHAPPPIPVHDMSFITASAIDRFLGAGQSLATEETPLEDCKARLHIASTDTARSARPRLGL